MNPLTVNTTAPRLRRIVKTIAACAVFVIGLILLPTFASMQSADTLPTDDAKQNLSPQVNSRPDILWMRGGEYEPNRRSATLFSPNGQMVITGDDFNSKITRASDGVLLMTINYCRPGSACSFGSRPFAFSSDSQSVAVLSYTNTAVDAAIDIWRISDKTLIRSIPITDYSDFAKISFSPDGTKIIAGKHIYNVSDGSNYFTATSGDPLLDVRMQLFSPDGQYVYGFTYEIAHQDHHRLVRWTVSSPVSTRTNIGGSDNGYPAAISPNGQYVVTNIIANSSSNVIRVSDSSTIFSFGLAAYAFSSDGQYLVEGVSNVNGTALVRLRRTSDWSIVWSVPAGQNNETGGMDITTYGQSIAVSFKNTRILNLADGSFVRDLTTLGYSPVPSLAFSSDGQTLVTANSSSSGPTNNPKGTIHLWNVADSSRRNINFPQSVGLGIQQIYITPDNQQLLTLDAINGQSQHIKFWNANDGSLIRDILQTNPTGLLSLSPDGQVYAVGQSGITYFYRTSDDSFVRTLPNDGGTGVFSPNNQLFAAAKATQSGNVNKIKILNILDGTELQTLNLSAILSRTFPNVAFSPDSQIVAVIEEVGTAVGSRTGIIELFRASDGALLQTLGTFDNWGASVAFSPDGQTVIGTGWDATVRIWRVSDGALLQTYNQETDAQPNANAILFQVAYSPDGSRFAYGRRDATVVMARNPYSSTPTATYTISGNITRGGSALSGVSVALSGTDSNGAMTTDANGNYSFTVNDGGSYTVTPTLAGNNFAPASQSFNFIAGNQTANFTASLVTHTISGNITRSGTALSNVTVNLSGSATGSTTTDAGGNYSLTVNEGGNYTVTPALAGNVFTPTSRNFNNVTTDQTGNFTALFSTYTISGNVKADGANLPSAFVSLNGTQTQTTTTDANGNYTFTANTYGNYTVTASKNGYVFAPANQTFNNLQANQTANFQNGTPLCAPASSGLAAWYKGEGSVLDYSGNNNNGSLYNGATFATGKVGQAFSFDGVDDRVSVADSSTLDPVTQLSIDVWIKPNNLNGNQSIVSKYDSSSNQISYFLAHNQTGRIEFNIWGSDGAIRGVRTDNSVLTQNVFSHLTATFDAATQSVKIYINGVQVPATVTNNGTVNTIFNSSAAVYLGAVFAGSYTYFFNGLIDEPQIYNRTLSQSEIQNIQNAGSAGVCLISSFTGGGSLDTTFGAGGKVVTPIRNAEDLARGTVIQSDGKIIVVGGSSNGSNLDFAIARYNADGSLDNSFGTNGKVTTPIGSSDDEAFSAAIQTDGKIVVSGYSIGNDADFAVVRYNINGSLDTSFGSGGKVTTAASSVDDYAEGVALQADGKIVAAGLGKFGSNDDFLVARYNTNGSLDTSFGSGGIRHTAIGSSYDDADSVVIQPDGKIILAGYAAFGNQYDFGIVRYNTDGSEDASFGSGGVVSTGFGGSDDFADSIALQADGKIVVVGDTNNGSNRDFAAARYNTNGSLDTSFGTNGRVITPIGGGLDIARSVKIQSDGKIVAAGVSNNGSNDDFAVVRYTTNGTLDTNFGAGGKVTTAIGNSNDGGNAVALQTDGNIVVAGYSYNGANNDFAVVRYNADGNVASQGSSSQTGSIQGKLVLRASNGGIATQNSDGTGFTQLTNDTSDRNPKWSPDGTKIVFSRYQGGDLDILVMNADGSNPVTIAGSGTYESSPYWSPLGDKIVFEDYRGFGCSTFGGCQYYKSAIAKINATGGGYTTLSTSDQGINDYAPQYSNDGSNVVFYRCSNGCDIYKMSESGTNVVRLTTNGNSSYPAWSPDGSKIIYYSSQSPSGIWLMNADGSNQTSFSSGNNISSGISYSGEGTKIAFSTNGAINIGNSDGTNVGSIGSGNEPAFQRQFSYGGGLNVNVTPLTNLNLIFSNVTQAGNTVATPLTASQLPALPSGYTLPVNAPMYDIRTSAGYSGNITVSFNVPNITSSATCANLRSLHYENGAWTTATNAAPSYNSAAQTCTVSQTVTSLSPFVVAQQAVPTAAGVSISGRVITPNDLGLTGATVTLTDSRGAAQTVKTGKGGVFIFRDVAPNEAYILTVSSKRYTYAQQIVTPTENLTGITFAPQ